MKAQSLDCSASSSRAARLAASRSTPRHAQRSKESKLGAPRGPDQVRDRRRVPGLEALALAPAALVHRAGLGLVLAERLRQGEQPDAVQLRALQDLAQPHRSLRPPVAEQLGVDGEDAEAAPPRVGAMALEAVANGGQKRGGVLGGPLGRERRVVRRAGNRPEANPVLREPVVLEVGGVGGVAPVGPDQAHRRPVDGEADRATRQPNRAQRRGAALVGALVEAGVGDARARRAPPRPRARRRTPAARSPRARRSAARESEGRRPPAGGGPPGVASFGRMACVAEEAISAIRPFACASWNARRGLPPSFRSPLIARV